MHKIQFSLSAKQNICIRHVSTLGYIFDDYIAECYAWFSFTHIIWRVKCFYTHLAKTELLPEVGQSIRFQYFS